VSARVDRSAIRRLDQKPSCESAAAIRAKNRFWRAPMRRDAGTGENFFIAKNRDSESTQSVFGRRRRVATGMMTLVSPDEELQKRLQRSGFLRY
jgi:hypothetical protein